VKRLLIANRGEIVARVARSAKALGLQTVAVVSAADRGAPHAQACDHAVDIGGERPAQSYLCIDQLLGAAAGSGADAVHPGYGFLSEKAEFADAVIAAGLTWVGPPPAAMRAMADKARARQQMAAAGVPVLPGYDGDAQDEATLLHAAPTIGTPIMVKAAAGGGGRGMRLVHQLEQLPAALRSAQAEALAAIGDGRVLLERALIAPRHVEVQLLADAHGTVLHLGERDCSVQRRHQKIVEEAPSPVVDPALRRQLGDAAVQVARAVGYVGAGTVEFLLEPDGRFWFMEMNTRLQVEHPVTEALTGLDLVEWQLRVARGERLPFTQDELLQRYEAGGHAIEVRLCAEDPARDFLPSAGSVQGWQPPPGVRCDHALASGWTVSPFYDSMLAKLIAHAPRRDEACARLAQALDETVCLGLATNRSFLAQVLRHPAFVAGDTHTGFIEQHFASALQRTQTAPSWLQAWAAAWLATQTEAPLPPMWQGWQPGGVLFEQDVPLSVDDDVRRWHVSGTPQRLQLRCGNTQHVIEAMHPRADGRVHAQIDGRPRSALHLRAGLTHWWLSEGQELQLEDRRLASARRGPAAQPGSVAAPMHGRVLQVLAQPGQPVQAGTLLLVMEAMKMEHQLTAPVAGTVRAVHAREGQQVAARMTLVEIG